MSMDEVKALMKAVGWGMLATTDGQRVGCRPMGGWAWFDDELWCATMDPSDKVTELEQVPNAEYCFSEPEGRHVRIAGPCTISRDLADKKRLYAQVPVLARYIPDPDVPQYVVIRMRPDRVRIMNSMERGYEDVPPR